MFLKVGPSLWVSLEIPNKGVRHLEKPTCSFDAAFNPLGAWVGKPRYLPHIPRVNRGSICLSTFRVPGCNCVVVWAYLYLLWYKGSSLHPNLSKPKAKAKSMFWAPNFDAHPTPPAHVALGAGLPPLRPTLWGLHATAAAAPAARFGWIGWPSRERGWRSADGQDAAPVGWSVIHPSWCRILSVHRDAFGWVEKGIRRATAWRGR